MRSITLVGDSAGDGTLLAGEELADSTTGVEGLENVGAVAAHEDAEEGGGEESEDAGTSNEDHEYLARFARLCAAMASCTPSQPMAPAALYAALRA